MPIKTYIGFLTQTDENAPTDDNSGNGVKNTFGGAMTFVYENAGIFRIQKIGAFKIGKTRIILPATEEGITNSSIYYDKVTTDYVRINCIDANGVNVNNLLGHITGQGTPITIEVS